VSQIDRIWDSRSQIISIWDSMLLSGMGEMMCKRLNSFFVCHGYMAQTDRQTDKPATHWKSAIFDVDDNWAKLDALPACVKTLYRQKEICPTTQKPHFQVHVVCHRQVRFTQLTPWIKATKWIPVWGKDHIDNSINYTQKKETAIEGTHQVTQGEQYLRLHELLLEIAKQYDVEDYQRTGAAWMQARGWEMLSSRLVRRDLNWANKLCNPATKKAWDWWGEVFLKRVSEFCEETNGAYIIEGPASEDLSEECLIE